MARNRGFFCGDKEVKNFDKNWNVKTRAIRSGHKASDELEHSEPIFATSSFTFETAKDAADCFLGEKDGNIYTRFSNPTVESFQNRLASMEEGDCCVATASGMSAIAITCLALLGQGDHILACKNIFGTTLNFFKNHLNRFGIESSFVDIDDISSWESQIRKNTKILFVETPSNPLTLMCDIKELADLAHSRNCILIVDNCLCTSALQQPIKYGADIVIHSATKYIDGQGRALGGAVVGSQDLVGEKIYNLLRSTGPSMSPFNAWIFLKGLETLDLRMKAHSKSANELSKWLSEQSLIEKVYYPGLETHPQHNLAKRQQYDFGGILSFNIRGDQEIAWKFMDSLSMISITANFGDVKTSITHPQTTTHHRLNDAELQESGITPGLVRLSVGLEDIDDIKSDILLGLEKANR